MFGFGIIVYPQTASSHNLCVVQGIGEEVVVVLLLYYFFFLLLLLILTRPFLGGFGFLLVGELMSEIWAARL